jgi:hypothetical protein
MTDKLEVVCPNSDACKNGCRNLDDVLGYDLVPDCAHDSPHPHCEETCGGKFGCPKCLPTSCVIVTEERPA